MQPSIRRSQVILRMPVDHVQATLILHDGARSDVMLFVPPTEDLEHLLGPSGPRFLPMIRGSKMHLVAREAIAGLGIQAVVATPQDDDLPIEVQPAMVQLKSGTELVGELRYSAPMGQARTADYLNTSADTFDLHIEGIVFHIVKAHVALVEER
ncbi:MAG: hypothetical protein H0T46_04675 [Deltaproteobacteria bacterium]|nr:hypothetical protein [Deltaproteobacteria bacterium]